MIRSYADCQAMFATRKRKLARNTYLEIDEDRVRHPPSATPAYIVKLHKTAVVTYYPDGRIMLDSGGWRTPTTKDRMNDFSPIRVWQDKGIWYCGLGELAFTPSNQHTFADGITFYRSGHVTGAGASPKDEIKLRRRVRKYAADLVRQTLAGTLKAPGMGDCWGCALHEEKTGKPLADATGNTSHLYSHLDENYLVPSLLANVIGTEQQHNGMGFRVGEGVSQIARNAVLLQWTGTAKQKKEHAEYYNRIAEPELIAAVANYFFRRLSMTPTRAIYRR